MKFTPLGLEGIVLVEPEPQRDERGSFARTYCRREFEEHGLDPSLAQCSISFNIRAGTLRGLHWQQAPHGEHKLVRCTRGAIFDVAVDVRKDAPTYCRWVSAELNAENGHALYLSPGFAHGFLTLRDESEVLYHISEFFHPESARGARCNDPAFGILWPGTPLIISERDRAYPDFRP